MVDFTRPPTRAPAPDSDPNRDFRRFIMAGVLGVALIGSLATKLLQSPPQTPPATSPDDMPDRSEPVPGQAGSFTAVAADTPPGEDEPVPDPKPPEGPAATSPDPTTSTTGQTPPPPTPRPMLFEGSLAGEVDFTGLTQTAGYNTVLSWLSTASKEDISARAKKEMLSYDQYFHHPADYRGHFISGEAVVVWLKVYPIDTNPAGIGDIYEGMFVNPKTEQAWFFHCIERNAEHLDLNADIAHVDGVFIKVYRFQNKKGETKDVPFLLAKNITRVEVQQSSGVRHLNWIIGGFALVMAFGVLVISTYARKKDEAFEAKLAEMKHKHREAHKAGGHAPPTTPPPPPEPPAPPTAPPGAPPNGTAPPPPQA